MSPRHCFAFRSLACLAAVCLLAAPSAGQEIQPQFRAQMALADAGVYQGRILCRMARLQQWANETSNMLRRETLRFDQSEQGTSMHYQLESAERSVAIDVEIDTVIMHRAVLRDGNVTAESRYVQRPGQPISLQVTHDGQTRTLTGDTLWQLWLEDGQLCGENLLPLCEMLSMDMPFPQFTQALETKLINLAETDQTPDRQAWRGWLAELSDANFAVREAADRRFRAAGTTILPFVRGIDPARLDAEQRYRLRRITFELEGDVSPDTVDATAEWLLEDPRVWVELLDREELSERTVAAAHLGHLLDGAIDFDADADTGLRAQQVVRLRDRVRGAFDRH